LWAIRREQIKKVMILTMTVTKNMKVEKMMMKTVMLFSRPAVA
jgi:hypothetical protein